MSNETFSLPMAFCGYACVSTLDQELAIQRGTLKAAGCEVNRAPRRPGIGRAGVYRVLGKSVTGVTNEDGNAD